MFPGNNFRGYYLGKIATSQHPKLNKTSVVENDSKRYICDYSLNSLNDEECNNYNCFETWLLCIR